MEGEGQKALAPSWVVFFFRPSGLAQSEARSAMPSLRRAIPLRPKVPGAGEYHHNQDPFLYGDFRAGLALHVFHPPSCSCARLDAFLRRYLGRRCCAVDSAHRQMPFGALCICMRGVGTPRPLHCVPCSSALPLSRHVSAASGISYSAPSSVEARSVQCSTRRHVGEHFGDLPKLAGGLPEQAVCRSVNIGAFLAQGICGCAALLMVNTGCTYHGWGVGDPEGRCFSWTPWGGGPSSGHYLLCGSYTLTWDSKTGILREVKHISGSVATVLAQASINKSWTLCENMDDWSTSLVLQSLPPAKLYTLFEAAHDGPYLFGSLVGKPKLLQQDIENIFEKWEDEVRQGIGADDGKMSEIAQSEQRTSQKKEAMDKARLKAQESLRNKKARRSINLAANRRRIWPRPPTLEISSRRQQHIFVCAPADRSLGMFCGRCLGPWLLAPRGMWALT